MLVNALKRLANAGFDTDVFRENRTEIDEANLLSLRRLSLVGAVLALFLFVLSLIPSVKYLSLTPGYGLLAGVLSAVFLLTKTVLKRHLHAVRYVWYVVMFLVYAAGILLGTVLQPTTSAVTFVVFIVVLPLFYLGRPVAIYALSGCMMILFIALTHTYKNAELANIDTANICVFCIVGFFTCLQNVRARMRDILSRQQLCSQRDTDGLTGLRNRMYCENEISHYIKTNGQPALFLILDIDHFKSINDTCGHECGDQALCEVTAAMRRRFRANDILGRLGGDEFIVFLPASTDSELMRGKVGTLIADVGKIQIAHPAYPGIGISVGISRYPEDGDTFQQLYKRADFALYRAKAAGKNQYCVYENAPEPESAV